jgi:WD40 repeat protein
VIIHKVRWSADGRMVLTCSQDSTSKIWDMKGLKFKQDLPGHSDEVNCCVCLLFFYYDFRFMLLIGVLMEKVSAQEGKTRI